MRTIYVYCMRLSKRFMTNSHLDRRLGYLTVCGASDWKRGQFFRGYRFGKLRSALFFAQRTVLILNGQVFTESYARPLQMTL